MPLLSFCIEERAEAVSEVKAMTILKLGTIRKAAKEFRVSDFATGESSSEHLDHSAPNPRGTSPIGLNVLRNRAGMDRWGTFRG